MMTSKKIAAILLSLIMTVCMIAVPAAAEGGIKAPKLYVDDKGSTLDIYIDGINSSYIKTVNDVISDKQKKLIKEKGLAWDCINISITAGTYADTDKTVCVWFNVLKSSCKTVVGGLSGGFWAAEGSYDNFDDMDAEYYDNISGMTTGYRIIVKNKKAIEFFRAHKTAKVVYEAMDMDGGREIKGAGGAKVSRLENEFIAAVTDTNGNRKEIALTKLSETPTVKADIRPAAPAKTKLTVSSKNGRAMLKWNAVNGAEKYQVYYSTDGGKTYQRYKTYKSTATKATFKMTKGTTYKFKVRSYRSENGKKVYSKWSNIKTVKY